jgi:hypothetical protein
MSVEHQRRECLSIEPASKTAARSIWPGTGGLATASALGTRTRGWRREGARKGRRGELVERNAWASNRC